MSSKDALLHYMARAHTLCEMEVLLLGVLARLYFLHSLFISTPPPPPSYSHSLTVIYSLLFGFLQFERTKLFHISHSFQTFFICALLSPSLARSYSMRKYFRFPLRCNQIYWVAKIKLKTRAKHHNRHVNHTQTSCTIILHRLQTQTHIHTELATVFAWHTLTYVKFAHTNKLVRLEVTLRGESLQISQFENKN